MNAAHGRLGAMAPKVPKDEAHKWNRLLAAEELGVVDLIPRAVGLDKIRQDNVMSAGKSPGGRRKDPRLKNAARLLHACEAALRAEFHDATGAEWAPELVRAFPPPPPVAAKVRKLARDLDKLRSTAAALVADAPDRSGPVVDFLVALSTFETPPVLGTRSQLRRKRLLWWFEGVRRGRVLLLHDVDLPQSDRFIAIASLLSGGLAERVRSMSLPASTGEVISKEAEALAEHRPWARALPDEAWDEGGAWFGLFPKRLA